MIYNWLFGLFEFCLGGINVVYEFFVKILNYICDWNLNYVWDKVKVILVYLKMKIFIGNICLFYFLLVKIYSFF